MWTMKIQIGFMGIYEFFISYIKLKLYIDNFSVRTQSIVLYDPVFIMSSDNIQEATESHNHCGMLVQSIYSQ